MTNWDYAIAVATFISAAGAIISAIATILISINISFKRELKQKQLEVVFNLVETLQNTKIYFQCTLSEPNYAGDIFFDFFSLKFEELHGQMFLNGTPIVYVSENFLYHHPMFTFMHNPFLPNSIAHKIKIMAPKGGTTHQYERNNDTVFISTSRDYEAQSYRREISVRYQRVDSFIKIAGSLSESIFDWLKEHKVTDLNTSGKAVNIRNYP